MSNLVHETLSQGGTFARTRDGTFWALLKWATRMNQPELANEAAEELRKSGHSVSSVIAYIVAAAGAAGVGSVLLGFVEIPSDIA